MKLDECMRIGEVCGLDTVEQCYNNIDLHAISIFDYRNINKELLELQQDIFYKYPDLFCEIFDANKEDLISKGWKTKDDR